MKYKKWLLKNSHSLKGKNIVITGANSGLGLAASFYFASLEASLIWACRNNDKAEQAKSEIIKEYPSADIKIVNLNLESYESVNIFCDCMRKERIDYFIFNAGVFHPKGNYKTSDNLELTTGVNYFANYLIVRSLLSNFKKNNTRLIFISSLAVYPVNASFSFDSIGNMKRNKYYGFSKRCISRLAYELSNKENIDTYIVHPGITKTNITNHEKTGCSSFFASIIHEITYLFVHDVYKASLVLIKSVCYGSNDKKYITPRGIFSISGYPKMKKIPSYAKKDIIEDTEVYLKEKLK